MLVLNVRGGARICVPADLRLITPYILVEQEDWFEDEISFVRRWLRPGMRAIDVGASYGTYTVAMARAVGSEGRVWAFEPTPQAADHLQRSLDLNRCGQVAVHRVAVSDRAGRAAFRIGTDSELNGIAETGLQGDQVDVDTVKLDDVVFPGTAGIDFIKLDVEGHEVQAIRGASGLLASSAPLLMFEARVRERIKQSTLAAFVSMGCGLYRLLPGPLMLAPFDPQEPGDPDQLNLFACAPLRARALANGGWLAEDGICDLPRVDAQSWSGFARAARYAGELVREWPSRAGAFPGRGSSGYADGLAAFAHSCERERPPAERLAWLNHAFHCVAEALDAADTLSRRLSYARLAWELGWKVDARDALENAAGRVDAEAAETRREPFLAPSPRYERLPGAGSAAWLKCAVIEQFEKLGRFSSIFDIPGSLANTESIRGLPFCSPEMSRRRQLARWLSGEQACLEPLPELCAASDENLNPAFWAAQGGQGVHVPA
jgi:FkbM family methyltransferase